MEPQENEKQKAVENDTLSRLILEDIGYFSDAGSWYSWAEGSTVRMRDILKAGVDYIWNDLDKRLGAIDYSRSFKFHENPHCVNDSPRILDVGWGCTLACNIPDYLPNYDEKFRKVFEESAIMVNLRQQITQMWFSMYKNPLVVTFGSCYKKNGDNGLEIISMQPTGSWRVHWNIEFFPQLESYREVHAKIRFSYARY